METRPQNDRYPDQRGDDPRAHLALRRAVQLQRDLRSVLAVQLAHDRTDEVLDALFLQIEHLRDAAIGHALSDELSHFEFASSESAATVGLVDALGDDTRMGTGLDGLEWPLSWVDRLDEPLDRTDEGGATVGVANNCVCNSRGS